MNSNNWISVKDKLPEYDKNVLWHIGNGQYLIDSITSADDSPHLLGGYDSDTQTVFSPATHWQPLPEPPNTENK